MPAETAQAEQAAPRITKHFLMVAAGRALRETLQVSEFE